MSSKLYFRKSDVAAALRECAAKARQEGREEGRAEATRMLEFATRLNGSASHVLKAIKDDMPSRDWLAAREGDDADEQAPNPLDAATIAYIDALIEAKTHHADSDGGEVAEVLRGWIEDPEQLQAVLADPGVLLKGTWDAEKHPRSDDGRFVSKEAIHAAKSDPKKAEELRARVTNPEQRAKLDAALEGKEDLGRTKRGEQQQATADRKAEAAKRFDRVRELKDVISTARRGGEEVPHEHFTELAEYLPHLTVAQLRSVRESLAASFWGRTRRDEMVTALVRHAKVRAEQMRAESEAGDALDFGMDAMHGAGGVGKDGAGRSELNPWREFDQDKSYSEAQHGGRIEQRKQLMNAVADGAKTSHGTPDMGSVLKQGVGQAEPAPVSTQVTQAEPKQPARVWEPEPKPATAAQNTAPTYTTDKPEGGATVSAASAHASADEYAREAKRIANAPGGNPDAAKAYGEAAHALRQVAQIHEAIDAEKNQHESGIREGQERTEATKQGVTDAQAAVDAARQKEQDAAQKVDTLRAGGDPKEKIAKLKEQLAASKKKPIQHKAIPTDPLSFASLRAELGVASYDDAPPG